MPASVITLSDPKILAAYGLDENGIVAYSIQGDSEIEVQAAIERLYELPNLSRAEFQNPRSIRDNANKVIWFSRGYVVKREAA